VALPKRRAFFMTHKEAVGGLKFERAFFGLLKDLSNTSSIKNKPIIEIILIKNSISGVFHSRFLFYEKLLIIY
jgi:hypothetical protein